MPMFHRRHRGRLSTNSSILPTSRTLESSRARLSVHPKRPRKKWLLHLVAYAAILGVTLFVLYYFVLDQYGWVRGRCLKSWILWWDTVLAVECVEARTHQLAELDPTLHDANIPKQIPFRTSPVGHVHYTLTTALSERVLSLGLCSMEVVSNYCQRDGCIVHIWIVDEAAAAWRRNESAVWLDQIQNVLHSTRYCLHYIPAIMAETSEQQLWGPNCAPAPCPATSQALREWLLSSLASQQLPAHVSDAWRLVALADYGGLYLDADVLPLSPDLLRLPSPAIPTQSRLGAYRLNGGVLAMEAPSCDDHGPPDKSSPQSFLQSMILDHLHWAPRLARLPRERQTFGFLGPCALTRTYLDRSYRDVPTILARNRVEGAIGSAAVCHDQSKLSIHFSGKRKHQWYDLMSTHDCLKSIVRTACPRVLETPGLLFGGAIEEA